MNKLSKWLGIATIVVVLTVLLTVNALAASTDPVVVDGNPTCKDLGFDFGLKVEVGDYNGTFDIDGFHWVKVSSDDNTYFDWTSNLGMDAVIAKGGDAANVYYYDPESFADNGLHPPVNASGKPAAISHISFCYDYEVDVTKTAETTFTRTWSWDIDKEFDGEYWMFAGENVDHGYMVTVDKTGYTDSDWAVSGVITIANNTPLDAKIESVTDKISDFGPVDVTCGVTFPYTLPKWESLTCTYATPLPNGDSRNNVATVTTSGTVGGGKASAAVVFGEPTNKVNATVEVIDTNGGLGKTNGDEVWKYSVNFACPTDLSYYTDGTYSYTHINTATIKETGQSDQATVKVNCYIPSVSKDANTSFNRYWDWSIAKAANYSDLTLSAGQVFQSVAYTVMVTPHSTDADWMVTGTITVSNPNPVSDATVALTDMISGGIVASLDCGGTLTVPAGGSATCGYSAALPDNTSRINTATATLNGLYFEGMADVIFSATPTDQIDECIDVSDTFAGFLGTVCADEGSKTFTYNRDIGPYDVCGNYTVENTASFVTNDTGATGDASWNIDVTVPCEQGCTLTPGYWKTHSEYGPAPYDDTWALLPNGADTPFFLSGQSWYEVLWTPPTGGNPYYILGHAYIAARLNIYNGASANGIQDALYYADAGYWFSDPGAGFFWKYLPSYNFKKNKALSGDAIFWAGVLDDYNNGYIGPGHCDE